MIEAALVASLILNCLLVFLALRWRLLLAAYRREPWCRMAFYLYRLATGTDEVYYLSEEDPS